MRTFTLRQVGGLLLLVAFGLNLGGVVLYSAGPEFGWVVETLPYHAWERALFMGSYIVAALAVTVLVPALGEAGAAILSRLAATTFPMAVAVALVMEALDFGGPGAPRALVLTAVLLLFGAGALLGGALVASRIVPAWIGWVTIVWNVAWPAALSIVSPGDLYYPILHAIPWLLIGLPLSRPLAERPSARVTDR
jgi:hypothetical protein